MNLGLVLAFNLRLNLQLLSRDYNEIVGLFLILLFINEIDLLFAFFFVYFPLYICINDLFASLVIELNNF